jgi:diguanylate cyclase (GGDEF)-like protein
MNDILRHAAAMTRHREHSLVDTALLFSLVELLAADRKQFHARLFNVMSINGNQFELILTAWSEGRTVNRDEREYSPQDLPRELMMAVETQVMVTANPTKKGDLYRAWVPAVYDRLPVACIELAMSQPLTQRQATQVDGICSLYTNYLSLLRYSQIDTLTQLLNRKTFEDSLDKILLSYQSDQSRHSEDERRVEPASTDDWLAIIDIDHFKQVNDRYGHLFGDEVLILLADAMRKTFRRRDKLFRFGGEEFVVILRHASEERALQVFERFRLAVASRTFPQLGQMTVSVGVTRIYSMDSPTLLLGRADEALYYAKQHGRNQVRFYEELAKAGRVLRQVANTEAEMF